MRFARALAVVALAAASVLFNATPALAHTELRETDPPANATVALLPQFVRLTFSTSLPSVPTITVTDAAGRTVNSSPVSLRGNSALQPVEGTGNGRYTVTWRATAPDGHVINGTFAFAVGNANASPTGPGSPVPSPTAPVVAGSSPSGPAGPTSGTPAPPLAEEPAEDGSGPLWLWLAAGLLAVAVLVVSWYARRRRASAS